MLSTSMPMLKMARSLSHLLLANSSICTILTISLLLTFTSPILADSPNSPTSASSQHSNQTHPTQQGTTSLSNNAQATPSSKTSSPTDSKSSGVGRQQVTIVEQQPTDLSSMYVQIPIAEPGDTGVPDGVQQTLTSAGDTDSNGAVQDSRATSWTGPWPKKFQIGYIKQSDLHQVLIESLKNEPFVALGSPSASTKGGQAQQVSTSSPITPSKVSAKTSEAISPNPQKPVQWPQSVATPFGSQRATQTQPTIKNNNIYHHRPIIQGFRGSSSAAAAVPQPFHMAHNRFQQMNNNFQAHQTRSMFLQQPQKLLPITGNPGGLFHQQKQQQQQQAHYHYGLPMNSFKNEPIYTINNYPHQEQLDQNSMQLIMPAGQQFGQQAQSILGRPQKSTEYLTSTAWRPVTNSDKNDLMQTIQQTNAKLGNQISVGQIQSMSVDYPNLGDGFDDGFNAPNKDASSGGSMNRHPMLNNYLNNLDSNSGNRSARMSPSMQAKLMQQSLSEGTKTTTSIEGASSIKGGGIKSLGAKGSQDNTNNLSANRRRMQNGTAASNTTVSTSLMNSNASTTVAPGIGDGESANTSTTMAPLQSVTTGASSSITTTTIESDTQDPETEVIDVDTTEQPSTTTGASVESSSQPTSTSSTTTTTTTITSSSSSGKSSDQNPQQESQTSTTTASTTAANSDALNQSDSGETEVVTQGNVVQQSNAAALPTLSMNSDQASSTVGPSTTGSSREETTRSSNATMQSNDEATKGEVEGSAGETTLSKTRMDSMSDEALLAASIRTASEIGKTTGSARALSQQKRSSASATSGANNNNSNTSSSKKTRSPERLVQAPSINQGQQLQSASNNNGGRKSASSSGKLITKRPQQSGSSRAAKQVNQDSLSGAKGAKLSSGKSAAKGSKKDSPMSAKSKVLLESSRSAAVVRSNQKSEKLLQQQQQQQQPQPQPQPQPQVVSMTAAQAQSTAQTLASLLLSRCMSSSSCAHLLDICTTKQAMVPLSASAAPVDNSIEPSSTGLSSTSSTNNQSSAAWSMPIGFMSSNIMSLTQSLQADRVLKVLPQWKDAIENVVDHDTQTGYTLILPSNEALDRLLPSTLDSWLANSELLGQIIDNHILDSSETIDFMPSQTGRKPIQSRVIKNKGLQVNQHREKMVTINGKRLVYANQAAPSGGRIHVIDGFLDWPLGGNNGKGGSAKLLDIMDTLKQCDKFDGFVTLAEGTGLTQILKQDGPMTVFVPSNEALRKIPDEELEVIKNNSTALKVSGCESFEFLMYHVVNGSYFSQDLRDGQQLASILDMKPIQVGVRVDGCSRRLVEANTSPMRRPDIVAKNGVIHILDWYLTVRDNDWCEPIGKFESTSTPSLASERLQQLASETEAGYVTRMAMPINHKPAMSGQLQEGFLMAQSVGGGASALKQLTSGLLGTAASPVGSSMAASDDNIQSIIVTPTPLGSADDAPINGKVSS